MKDVGNREGIDLTLVLLFEAASSARESGAVTSNRGPWEDRPQVNTCKLHQRSIRNKEAHRKSLLAL